jgi:hypothetical protein
MQNQASEHREIVITAPGLLYDLLEEAEAALRMSAMVRPRAGILVTRHDPHRYTLALDETVPFGETREQSFF